MSFRIKGAQLYGKGRIVCHLRSSGRSSVDLKEVRILPCLCNIYFAVILMKREKHDNIFQQ